MPDAAGRIFEIQRFCLHDGPGIRTTVFLQGCPLRCLWCHNPEGATAAPLLSFQVDRCVGCGWCMQACAHGAHRIDPDSGVHVLDRDRCVVCGACAQGCYAGALEVVGREVTVAEVLAEVLADEPFYATSGGGMTLSGGEPLAQPAFAVALLQQARAHRVHTAVETCGAVPFTHLERILELTDLFLFDVKETDPERHRRLTGADNQRILDNLRRLRASGAAIRLRLPLVPGLNDRPDHYDALGALAHELAPLEGVEIMPYHRLGTSKLERFGWQPRLAVEPPSRATVDDWTRALGERGVPLRTPQPAAVAAASPSE